MYPTELMCTITATVMQTGRDLLPTLIPFPKVLQTSKMCSSKTNLDRLPFYSSHQDFAKKFLLQYLSKVSLYKTSKEINSYLEKGDILNRIVRSRTRAHQDSSFTSNPATEQHQFADVSLAEYFHPFMC